MTRVLVSGGGTGGHVMAALAVVEELRRREPAIVLRYVGSGSGIEARLSGEAGIEFVGVATGKLRRSSKGVRGLVTLDNIRDALRVPRGVLQARRAVRTFGPDAVLATGGYVCVPAVIAAWMARTPVLVHEQTVTVGLANRIAARFATRFALSFEGSLEQLPKRARRKAFVSGNPTRRAIYGGDRERAAHRFGFLQADADLPCVYVTGGVQGSRVVNHAVRDALGELLDGARVLHQCGTADAEELLEIHRTMDEGPRGRWHVQPYMEADEIADAYALADVVMGRSGAGTVNDLSALGKPAVFIPLEPSSGDEQRRNAQRCADAGAAIIIRQGECTADVLLATLTPLLADRDRRDRMGAAARGLFMPRAVEDLTDALLGMIPGRRADS